VKEYPTRIVIGYGSVEVYLYSVKTDYALLVIERRCRVNWFVRGTNLVLL
jgi:hypothetical protein